MFKRFYFYFAIFLSWLFVPAVALAEETTQLNLQQPFGSLGSIISVSGQSIGDYIEAIYLFGSAVIVGLAIVMVIVAGIEWVVAGGEPGKINAAKDRLFKAFIGLFIALFAVFMLRTISPGTVVFNPLNINAIVGESAPPPSSSSPVAPPTAGCTALIDKPSCEANTTCEWKSTVPDTATNFGRVGTGDCILKTSGPLEQDKKDLLCAQIPDGPTCRASSRTGCVWTTNFCNLNPALSTPPASNNCASYKDSSGCNGDSNCRWITEGCVTQSMITSNLAANPCNTRDSSGCTSYSCYWASDKCNITASIGSACGSNDECGDMAFCQYQRGSDIWANGKCSPIRAVNSPCFLSSIPDVRWQILGISALQDDQACSSRHCLMSDSTSLSCLECIATQSAAAFTSWDNYEWAAENGCDDCYSCIANLP